MAHVHPSIPFPPTPVPHAPSPLAFGFGCSKPTNTFNLPLKRPGWGSQPSFGGASPSSISSFGFGGSHLPSSPTVPSPTSYFPSPTSFGKRKAVAVGVGSSPSLPNSRRRVREESEDEEMEEGRAFVSGGGRMMKALKKSRVEMERPGLGLGALEVEGGKPDVDLGVLLALLPSTSLLPILTSLIQQNPSLKPNVLALIPSPSLPTALEALRLAEQNVMNAVPVGWHKAGGTVSEIYVVGRVKDPVGEVTSLIQSHLPFFTTQPSPSHPTTTFAYLSQSTTVLLRLLHTLPALPSITAIWPVVANEWLKWVEAVSRLVNEEGGMVSANVAEGWIRELEAIAGQPAEAEEEVVRAQMREVGSAWVERVGWLVGRSMV